MPFNDPEMARPGADHGLGDGESAVRALLQKAGLELQVFSEVERRLQRQAAPRFSLFDFVKSDEVGLSGCFAALLDPRGSHGQGVSFLSLFLEHLQLGQEWRRDLDQAHVVLEAQANGMRRIDICIKLPGNRWIAIENKPWAGDQNRQLCDYGIHLQQTAAQGMWVLVYLSQREPSRESIPAELQEAWSQAGNFLHMKFSAAVEWLRRCELETRPPAVRLFIQELAKFLSCEVCGEVEMGRGEIVKQLALESDQSLRAALVIAKGIGDVKQHLLQQGLREPYERAISEARLTLVWTEIPEMTANAGFGARVPEHAEEWNIRYEFERAGLGGLFWGLKRKSKSPNGAATDASICEAMRAMGFGAGKTGPWWVWYSTDCTSFGISNPMRNWISSEEPWLALRRGPQLAERIASHTVEVATGIRDHLAKTRE